MLSQNNIFFGVLLLIVAAQVQGFEYLEDVVERARKNAALYESGKDIGKPVFEAEGMAVDVGDLNNETFPSLPDNVKVSILACYQLLTKEKNQSPEDILSAMTQSPLLQSHRDASVKRTDIFMSKEKAWWNIFGGKSEAQQIKELDTWLTELISNNEFAAATHLHGDSSINVANAAMKIYKNLRDSCSVGTLKRDIINLAVLKYPQPNTQEVVERHIKVWAWVDCDDSDKNGGITGEYTKRQFTPRDSVISSLSENTRNKVIAKIESIFAEIGPKDKKPAGPEIQLLKDVVEHARDNLDSYLSGVDVHEPIFNSRGVAADIRNLNRKTFPLLSDKLKITIASCHKVLIKNPHATVERFYAAMMANPFLEPHTPNNVHRMDKFMPGISHWWNLFGRTKAKNLKGLEDWFVKFINNTEFLTAAHLINDSSVSMTESTMLIFNALRDSCGGHKGKLIKRTSVDLAAVEYPTAENGSFHLHHITVHSWVDCSTWKKKGGITCEYMKTEFRPRDEMLEKMTPQARSRALSFIGDIFSRIEPEVEATTTAAPPASSSLSEFATESETTHSPTPTPIPTTSLSMDSGMNSPTDFVTSEFTTASTVMETTSSYEVDE